jgi:hypothetical protein
MGLVSDVVYDYFSNLIFVAWTVSVRSFVCLLVRPCILTVATYITNYEKMKKLMC